MEQVDILGTKVDQLDLEEAIKRIEAIIQKSRQGLIVTANPEIVMLARKDPEFSLTLKEAEMVTADGIGLVIASRILGTPLKGRVAGIDLTQGLFNLAAKRGYRVFLLGAKPEVVEQAAKNISADYPNLNIVGHYHGYFKEDQAKVLDYIRESRPDILLVALGMGKQEKWIRQHQKELGVPVAIGVGGSFDVFAGAIKRAPLWVQKLGLEWLYRLIKQPSRLPRMLELPKFLFLVVINRLTTIGK